MLIEPLNCIIISILNLHFINNCIYSAKKKVIIMFQNNKLLMRIRNKSKFFSKREREMYKVFNKNKFCLIFLYLIRINHFRICEKKTILLNNFLNINRDESLRLAKS